jgi:hypothetical protein
MRLAKLTSFVYASHQSVLIDLQRREEFVEIFMHVIFFSRPIGVTHGNENYKRKIAGRQVEGKIGFSKSNHTNSYANQRRRKRTKGLPAK